jgi:predicted TIM-barrel fold metal-dependent hydrolase
MEPIRWRVPCVIDAHTHYRGNEPIPHYLDNMAMANHTKGVIVSCRRSDLEGGGDMIYRFLKDFKGPERFGRFYIYGGLLHLPDKVARGDGRDFPRQIDVLKARGFDGIKMMEGSPYWKKFLPHPLDHEYYRPFWDAAEEKAMPITIHLANPADCWLSDEPAMREMYRDAEPQEEYFRQAEAVLAAHPRLRITFAHFMFLASQLDRLDRFFVSYPEMRVDLAMGDYMYHLCDDLSGSRAFFIKWADRILFGTDLSDLNSVRLARAKSDQVRLFLESDESYVSPTWQAMDKPPQAGPNGRVEFHGLNLPLETLHKIFYGNAEKLLGMTPKPPAQ